MGQALKPLFNEIVDAIHEKDGQTDGIAAEDFPARIRAIPSGGLGGVTLESIEITVPPQKTSYAPGDVFDPVGMVVTARFSNGQRLPVSTESLTFDPSGPLEVGVESVAISFQWGLRKATAYQPITVSAVHIYGAEWDGSSTTKFTRCDDAYRFVDPSPAVGDGPGSSPFDSLYPWSGMTKTTDGNNVLVAIPKYWVKVSHFPFKVQIAGKAIPGYQVSPAHRDREDGKGARDVVYIGRYECDSEYKSRSGQEPLTKINLAESRKGIHALGPDYWQADYALQLTWWFLYIVEFADWDGQAVIGRGNVDSGSNMYINTGATDSMTYHTGRAAGTDGQTAVQYRGIENPWGNIREWRDGIIFSDANICTYNNPANFSDSYNGTGATVRSNKRATTGGWIKAWESDSNDPSFIYVSDASGAWKEFVPDFCDYITGVRALNVGGTSNNTDKAGPFYIDGEKTTYSRTSFIGSRLQKLP